MRRVVTGRQVMTTAAGGGVGGVGVNFTTPQPTYNVDSASLFVITALANQKIGFQQTFS